MPIHGPPGDIALRVGGAPMPAPLSRSVRLPWMNTLATLRRLCGVWLAAVVWMAFQPLPSRAQPESPRTAFKPTSETSPRTPDDEDGPAVPSFPAAHGDLGTAGQRFPGTPPKVLILQNGRLIEGKISQSSAGYMVDKPNGSILVPFDRVQFTAFDRRDALRQLRGTLPAGQAKSNVVLARWCLTYNLLDEAADELRQALELDPSHNEARTMLKRLDELRNPDRTAPRESSRDARTDDGFDPPPLESLGGLSRKTAQRFTSEIQPILWNKCGNASCHGGAPERDRFVLTNGRGGSNTRVYAERNLAAAVRRIDFDTPDRSALLTVPRGAHGGMKSVFSGPRGAEQADTLRQWVRAAAAEMREQRLVESNRPSAAPSRPSGEARPLSPDGQIVRVSAEREADDEPTDTNKTPLPATRRRPNDDMARPADGTSETRRGGRRADEPADRLAKARKESQPDAFDPDEFNRQSVPATGAPDSKPKDGAPR